MNTLFGTIKEVSSLFLICLVSTVLFLVVGDIFHSFFQYSPPMSGGFDLVKLAGVFYVFPFCFVSSFLGKSAMLRRGRFMLFLFVSFFLWNKNAVLDSVVLEGAFLLSFICLLGLEKAKDRGKFRFALFK